MLLAFGNHAEFLVTFSFVTNLRFPKDRIKNEINVWVILFVKNATSLRVVGLLLVDIL